MFDFVLLFKRDVDSEEYPSFSSKFPEKADFPQEEFQYIIPNAIPRKFDKSEVYMFNTPSFYCYDYSFRMQNIEAAVLIITSHFHPSLYIDFLRAIDSSFNSTDQESKSNPNSPRRKSVLKKIEKSPSVDADTDVFCRFVYVHSLLTSWSSNDDGDLVINYPFDSFIIKLSPDLSIYSSKYKTHMCSQYQYLGADSNRYHFQTRNDDIKAEDEAISALHSWTDVFDVAPLVPHVETLWAAAIQNKGVMVVAPRASIASYSAISILSMLEPMKYAEPCLLFSQIGDPRFNVESMVPNALQISKNKKFRDEYQIDNNEVDKNKDNKFIQQTNTGFSLKSDISGINSYINDNLMSINDDFVNQTIEHQIMSSTYDSINNSLLNNINNDINDDCDIPPSKFKIVATTFESYAKLVRSIAAVTSLSESQSIALLNMNFSAIITIKATQFKPTQNLKCIYSKKTKHILKKFLALMNLTLLSDPYFDLLEKEIDEKQFLRLWPNDNIICAATIASISQNHTKYHNLNSSNSSYSNENNNQLNANTNNNTNDNNYPKSKGNPANSDGTNDNSQETKDDDDKFNNPNNDNVENDMKIGKKNSKISSNNPNFNHDHRPSPEELIEFYKNIQKTKTFKKWRHIREDRDQLRMGFLSVLPKDAVEQVPDDKLQEAYEKLNLLLNVHKKDEHYRIILQKNLSIVKKRIRDIEPL